MSLVEKLPIPDDEIRISLRFRNVPQFNPQGEQTHTKSDFRINIAYPLELSDGTIIKRQHIMVVDNNDMSGLNMMNGIMNKVKQFIDSKEGFDQ